MKSSRSIVKQHFAEILTAPDKIWYGAGKHAQAKPICPHMAEEMRYPRGAGDVCYAEAATAFRMTGDDPGMGVQTPMDVPQDLITANRQAFVDGLRLAAPDDVMAAYLVEKLAEEKFEPSDARVTEKLYNQIVSDFPRITAQAARNVCPRRVSLAHDVRQDFDDQAAGDVFKPRHDRKNLSQADILRTYQTFHKHPAFYLALQLWQTHVKGYFQEMEDTIVSHLVPAYQLAMGDSAAEPSEMTERFPLHHVVHFSANSVDLPQQLIFYGAAATAQAELNSENAQGDTKPTIADMLEGFHKMQPAGFFRRSYESQWGERKIMCPFGATAVRWLSLDLGGEGLPQDSAIAQCAKKIESTMADNEHLQNMAKAVQKAMQVVMDESDPQFQTKPACPHAR
jgi:hypothetical protein